MIQLKALHHIAIIASDYFRSRDFYCHILGFTLIDEQLRPERQSWKGDLALNGHYLIELFSFPDSPARSSFPEACGLRHLAFSVDNLSAAIIELHKKNISCEAIRIDPMSGRQFTFFQDPDGLPLELYQG